MTHPIILCLGIIIGAATHDAWQHRYEDSGASVTVWVMAAAVLGAGLTMWEVFK